MRIPLLLAATFLLLMPFSVLAKDRLPNLVVIMADDLGIEGVGAYGGQSYQTPNLDQLAAGGLRFTHCFANPVCSPTRAQMLTGRYPFRNGIPRIIYLPDQHREFLDPNKETSFATILKQKGYATAMAGKWQLSFLNERDLLADHGFDQSQMWQIFHNGEKTSRYANPTMRQNGKVLQKELHGGYGPAANVEFLIDFMKQHKEQPFLVYYTALLPHYPWEPTPDSDQPLKPADGDGDKKYMKDMVEYLDSQVGKIVAAIDELNLRDNTLIIFTGDNGCDQRIVSTWTDGTVTRQVHGGKASMTDRGMRVPLIANWPGTIEAGRVNDDLIDLSDMMPTLLELAHAPVPDQYLDGRSFAPQLMGQAGNPRSWIHSQNGKQRLVRNRDFLLINGTKLRPVVEFGLPPGKTLKENLTPQQLQAKQELETVFQGLK
ncbi:sulfatase-like hydrolase/transferase [Bremerella sp. JC770]|uniref:sulfatase-like hydrolase/transferase n=1 Tax=Bremerella sp. JC770 TaxID=3232137 RepID=UPI00345A3F56